MKYKRSVNTSIYLTLENILCGGIKLTKNIYAYHYNYSGYGIGFDRK